MIEFLNRNKIIEALEDLFNNAESEIILVVPFIKLSDSTYNLIRKADERGVEITIIYKQDQLHISQREKLSKLNNLNLLTHPDIHAKCYLNDDHLIIASMNLYEYSEKYNREMGIRIDVEISLFDDLGDCTVVKDALEEVRKIVKSSRFEKKSVKTIENGFRMNLLRTKKDLMQTACKYVNGYFDNKKFELSENLEILCDDYIDNIDICIDYEYEDDIDDLTGEFQVHRILIKPKWEKERLERVHSIFKKHTKNDTSFPNFTVYWDSPKSNFTIYKNRKFQPKWNELDNTQVLKKMKQGIDSVVDRLKIIERELRN